MFFIPNLQESMELDVCSSQKNWQRLVFVRWFVLDEEAFSAITLEPLSLTRCPVFNLEETAWKGWFDCLSWLHLEAVTQQTEPWWQWCRSGLLKSTWPLQVVDSTKHGHSQWVLSVRQLSIPEPLPSKQDVYHEAFACVCTYIYIKVYISHTFFIAWLVL